MANVIEHHDYNEDMIAFVTAQMTGTDRHYHNLSHIVYMFQKAKDFNMFLSIPEIWAIWFHDIIYYPGGTNNEELSADVAMTYAGRYSTLEISEVYHIKDFIMMTKDHKRPFHPFGASTDIIDLDLASLGEDWETYDDCTKKIRKEFHHYDDAKWAAGRIKFINSFLERDTIYFDKDVRAALEDKARANLEKERLTYALDKI